MYLYQAAVYLINNKQKYINKSQYKLIICSKPKTIYFLLFYAYTRSLSSVFGTVKLRLCHYIHCLIINTGHVNTQTLCISVSESYHKSKFSLNMLFIFKIKKNKNKSHDHHHHPLSHIIKTHYLLYVNTKSSSQCIYQRHLMQL